MQSSKQRFCSSCGEVHAKQMARERNIKRKNVLLNNGLCVRCGKNPIHFKTHCLGCGTERTVHIKDWVSKNKDRVIEAGKRRIRDGRAALSTHKWKVNNKTSQKIYSINRYAKLRGSDGKITAGEWNLVLWLFDKKCVYCGKSPKKLTADHEIPISRGGSNLIENIVPACKKCNTKKNRKTFKEFVGEEITTVS